MSDITLYGAAEPPARQPRWVSKSKANIWSKTELQALGIGARAQLEGLKVQAIEHVARTAITSVGMLTEQEAAVAQAVPLAGTRVEKIGNVATLAIMQQIMDGAARIGRL